MGVEEDLLEYNHIYEYPIGHLKGIGPKKVELFNKLGIYTSGDLLRYYPRDYESYESPILIKDIRHNMQGKRVAIFGMVAKRASIYRTGNYSVSTVIIKDIEGRFIKCKFYNMPYISKTLPVGVKLVFRGLLSNKRGELAIEQAKLFKIDEYNQLEGKLLPIYSLTKGLNQKTIINSVKLAFDSKKEEGKDYLPEDIKTRMQLMGEEEAIYQVHFPTSSSKKEEARRRIIFDDFFLFSMAVLLRKNENLGLKSRYIIEDFTRLEAFKNNLPFELTKAQDKSWQEIAKDLSSSKAMNRLLQGDVGSGKTIIAILALLATAFNGFQGALMAPTEVLASQEYKEIAAFNERYKLGLKVVLLTGSIKAKEKRNIYEALENGEIDIVVGTHAIIQEKVIFKNLALVITDEQHRFGVGQRKALKDKSGDDNPNILVMSATPIPRTLGWILYGDLDISVIDELPAGRKPIKNAVVDSSYRPNAYRFIKSKIEEGQQAYVICPMIEENEDMKLENVIDYSQMLASEFGSKIKVSMLHGRMKAEEKKLIMDEFARGDSHVLVSTTVIEVGVNVPNATVMLIENAERFGLSQLHQLRGRVGRGNNESFCMFMSESKNESTKERLDIIASSNNGFLIAEKDLEMRGPGDFFGSAQSGDLEFSMAYPERDMAILNKAVKIAKEIIEDDSHLEKEKNKGLREMMEIYKSKTLEKINL